MRKPHILIVEDAQTVRRLVRVTLEDHGCDLVEAASGDEAMAALATRRPDLVILDRGLPDIDGLEVLAAMRAHPELSSVPVILLTGRATPVDVVSGLSSGAFDFIAKPFEPAELAARVTVGLRVMALTDELRQRNADLTMFASRAAHDLKSPLTAIKGLADTLAHRSEHLPEQTKTELLRMISSSADRAASMVQDLLALARYDVVDEDPASPGALDPQGIIERALGEAAIDEADHVAVTGSFAPVSMPAADLLAVVSNLVDNAVHYGRGHDGRLELRIRGEVADGRLRLSVEDRGPGVPTVDANRVFEAFYRPAASLEQNPSSTGVGLAIVRRAVDRAQGTVTVVTAEPFGAKFIVDLPLASAVARL
jgi:signal transduction histidine kinase